MKQKKALNESLDNINFELPPASKWHKPAINRVVASFGSRAKVEIWPGVIIKLDAADLIEVMRMRWNLKRGRAQGTLIVNGSLIDGRRGHMTLQKFLIAASGKNYIYFKSIDRLDFRRKNLEIWDPQTRSIKQKKRVTPTTSIFKGVSLISKQRDGLRKSASISIQLILAHLILKLMLN